ncbi:subtilisin-like protease SBT1.5 [Mangifera indica]|uniref:subtilisin-like protease SBT1.5 n=1 Tax=Mangifera indica TaxID=29780 RepID=UPI001CFB89FB|nr:subtilisin-like protease SBT1.5 [Mangifera indica]
MDNTNSPLHTASDGGFSHPWAHGSGHVNRQKALSAGLVYDISTEEYIAFVKQNNGQRDEESLHDPPPNVVINEATIKSYPELLYSEAKLEKKDSTIMCCSI